MPFSRALRPLVLPLALGLLASPLAHAMHAATKVAREAPVARMVSFRGARTCEVKGKAATLDLVMVTPAGGEAPFRLAVSGLPATVRLAPPSDARAMHAVVISGALAFEGEAAGEWAHFVTARAAQAGAGMVRISRGVRLTSLRGAAGGAVANVELDRSVKLPDLALPCAALALDEPATADGIDAPAAGALDGTSWVSKGERLTLHAQPGAGASYTVELSYPAALVLGRARAKGRFALLDSWRAQVPAEVSGWADEADVEGYLPQMRGPTPPAPAEAPPSEPIPALEKGAYEGSATIPAGTPIYAAPEARGAWGTVRDAARLKVRWRTNERWVQIVSAPGLSGIAGHAFVDRAAVRLPLAPGSWRVTGAPLVARLGHTATRLKDGRVLIVGGWGAPANDPDRRVPLASAELYQPGGGEERFVVAASLATARAGHTATLLNDGRVLVVGGEWIPPADEGIALASAELYDPQANAWRTLPPLGDARIGHTATLLTDGTVLIAGGDDGHGRALETAELWDPKDGRFHAVGSLATRRYDHTATRLASGKVLIVGGRHKNYALREWWVTFPIDAVELYDPATRAFSAAGTLPAGGRTRHSATLLPDGHVFITGGARDTDLDLAGIAKGALLYDPNGLDEEERAGGRDGGVARDGLEISVGGGSAMSRLGGNEDSEAAPPVTGSFRVAGDSTEREDEARGDHSATSLDDGRVMIVAGPFALLYDEAARRFDLQTAPLFPRTAHSATLLLDGRLLVVGGDPVDDHPGPTRPGAELLLPAARK